MSDEVQFEGDNRGSAGYNQVQQEPKMNQWLVKHGYAKDAKGAQKVLLFVVVFNLVIAFVLIKFFL